MGRVVADARAGRLSATCPDCGGPVRPDRERLCPRCGYPLVFLRGAPVEAEAPARTPGEREDATSVLSSDQRLRAGDFTTVDEAPRPRAGEIVCPRCGEPNPPERIRCQRCGLELRTGPAVASVPPPVPAAPAPRPMRRWWPLLAAVAIAVALIVAAVLLANRGPDMSAGPGGAGGAPGAQLVRIDPGTIRAAASSTNSDERRFRVANTVDGDRNTAWQSDGARVGSNVGVRLTYRFATPVRLARIGIVNGFARSERDFANNERVARFLVRGDDAFRAQWNVADTAEPQQVDLPSPTVTTLTLEVEGVYPGARFPDLAISELAFYTAG